VYFFSDFFCDHFFFFKALERDNENLPEPQKNKLNLKKNRQKKGGIQSFVLSNQNKKYQGEGGD